MARKRLTRRLAADDTTPFPGDVGNPDRTDPKSDAYDPYQQTVNYELPDMRAEWRQEKRNEIGFGVPTYASVRQAASKAVKLAMLLLGDKVEEDVIEAQAKDFMRLGSDVLDSSLSRFMETEKLYAEDEDEDDEEKKEEAKKGEDEDEDEEEKEEAKKGEDEEEEEEKEEAKKGEEDDEEKKEEAKKGEEDEEEKEEAKAKSSVAELDIEMVRAEDDEEDDEEDTETASLLASIFAEEEPEEEGESEEKEADEKKAGISKLGGQPKVAADMSSDDIGSIWDDAPDVSQVFGQ